MSILWSKKWIHRKWDTESNIGWSSKITIDIDEFKLNHPFWLSRGIIAFFLVTFKIDFDSYDHIIFLRSVAISVSSWENAFEFETSNTFSKAGTCKVLSVDGDGERSEELTKPCSFLRPIFLVDIKDGSAQVAYWIHENRNAMWVVKLKRTLNGSKV